MKVVLYWPKIGFFSLHRVRESLTKDGPTAPLTCSVPFPPMFPIVSFVPHLTIAGRYCIPSATSVMVMKSYGN